MEARAAPLCFLESHDQAPLPLLDMVRVGLLDLRCTIWETELESLLINVPRFTPSFFSICWVLTSEDLDLRNPLPRFSSCFFLGSLPCSDLVRRRLRRIPTFFSDSRELLKSALLVLLRLGDRRGLLISLSLSFGLGLSLIFAGALSILEEDLGFSGLRLTDGSLALFFSVTAFFLL